MGRRTDVDLDDLYDEDTLAAIDGWQPGRGSEPTGHHGGWRGRVAAGTLTATIMTGIKDALDPPEPDEVVELRPELRIERRSAVTVFFVPGDPQATLAVVRPWLLGG